MAATERGGKNRGKQKNDTEIIKHLFCLGGFVLPHIAGERRNTAS